jgi:hypothetical protein
MSDTDVLPYAEVCTEELTVAAALTCEVTLVPAIGRTERILVDGCPACNHATLFDYSVKVVTKAWPPDVHRLESPDSMKSSPSHGGRTHRFTVYCQCGVNHPGAPDGTSGCGRYWMLQVKGQ